MKSPAGWMVLEAGRASRRIVPAIVAALVWAGCAVRTPLVAAHIDAQAQTRGLSAEETVQQGALELAAVKRLIEPHEIADLVRYLCTQAPGMITGAALPVDAGWTAR